MVCSCGAEMEKRLRDRIIRGCCVPLVRRTDKNRQSVRLSDDAVATWMPLRNMSHGARHR